MSVSDDLCVTSAQGRGKEDGVKGVGHLSPALAPGVEEFFALPG